MDAAALLPKVKTILGVTGEFQDELLKNYITEVTGFMHGAGVPEDTGTDMAGVVAIGVSDLWNYGNGGTSLSPYFIQRVTQLAYGRR